MNAYSQLKTPAEKQTVHKNEINCTLQLQYSIKTEIEMPNLNFDPNHF